MKKYLYISLVMIHTNCIALNVDINSKSKLSVVSLPKKTKCEGTKPESFTEWYALGGLITINPVVPNKLNNVSENSYSVTVESKPKDVLISIFTGAISVTTKTVTIKSCKYKVFDTEMFSEQTKNQIQRARKEGILKYKQCIKEQEQAYKGEYSIHLKSGSYVNGYILERKDRSIVFKNSKGETEEISNTDIKERIMLEPIDYSVCDADKINFDDDSTSVNPE
jgi:F0F1-type ATP synthase epsilon subunit